MQQKICELPPNYDAQDEKARDQNGAWAADKNERMSVVQVTVCRHRDGIAHVYSVTEEKGKCYSTSHDGTIHSSCLMTCSVDL